MNVRCIPVVRRLAAVTMTLLFCAAAPAAAQRVRGTVVREDGATPAAGIVVAASGADGRVAARVLSTASGAFDLPLPAAGRYSVSALRIGFRPTVVPDLVVPDSGAVTVRIVLSGGVVSLEAVAVRSSDVCGTSNDPKLQVVQVWTEARTALASAALWSRESLDAEWITFQRELLPQTEFVKAQTVRTRRESTTHAFQSIPADTLAARGYMVPDARGQSVYHAPDPDALLSDRFVETHCFHLEPPRDDTPGLVGIGFGPQRTRGDRVEIEGTLWIDRASSELRWLEYRYVGLPEGLDVMESGGRVEFLRLPEGPWMVSRWHIRMPITGPAGGVEKGYAVTMLKKGGSVLRGISVSGGAVSRVWRRGELLYTARGSGIALQLVRSDSTVLLGNAEVRLDGTDYAWRADSTGLVRAAPVLEGRYTAQIATPDMLALGAPAIEREVQIAPTRTRVDTVMAPMARDIVREACGADGVKRGLGALYGTVRESAGRPAAGRAVTVSYVGSIAGLSSARAFIARESVGMMTDDAGAWHVCDVPRGKRIAVRSNGDDGIAMADTVLSDMRWIQRIDLQVSKAATDAPVDSSVATLELLVHDAAGTGLSAASLELTSYNGEQRKVTTDARGRALVAAFPPGRVTLRAKRAEFMTGEVVFSAAGGRNTVPVTLNRASLPVLDTVRVIGNRRASSRMDGFETRRLRREASVSLTAEDIAKRAPGELADLLRTLSGVRLADSSGVTVAELTRGFKLDRDANAKACLMRVVLDGVLVPLEAGVNVVRPGDVRGLEVFLSSSRAPSGLGIMATDAACGLIAIYTGKD